ncbi:MAG: DUF1795 domain-containing protein [Alphaproteobacteria bacterium]|nr:DUF1795 domain-containing protein [Alphaproteobacteria bacterium]
MRKSCSLLTIFFIALAFGGLGSATAQTLVGTAIVDGNKVELLSDNSWRYADTKQNSCRSVHLQVQLCAPEGIWKKIKAPSADITAAFSKDARNYLMFIIEEIGSNLGVSQKLLRKTAIETAALGAGIDPENVPILELLPAEVDGQTGETVVYAVNIDGVPVVIANTMVIRPDLTIQVVQYTIGKEYKDAQRRLVQQILDEVKINE